jgi:molybdopterin molybdotransferase
MNHPTVPVHRRPKIAVLATGDELVMPGANPGPGEIVYSNGYATMALARREGADVIDLSIVPDRLDETAAAIRRARASGADILVTSGGASVGDHDLVQNALASEGLALSFWKVAMRPANAAWPARAHARARPAGQPCAVLFLVRSSAGLRAERLRAEIESAVLGCDLPENDERADTRVLRLRRDGAGRDAVPGPGQLHADPLAKADCLLICEPYAPPAVAGSRCAIVKLGQ